jgi:hypothetical protein
MKEVQGEAPAGGTGGVPQNSPLDFPPRVGDQGVEESGIDSGGIMKDTYSCRRNYVVVRIHRSEGAD